MQLEIRNLHKTYPLKGRSPVVALNGVSLRFPETGLIFVLGKSGSGKSTLLNVMGGLDKADDGEIIINGKSSKDFNGSEMDSYRNTYLGFIFQEYNILNDFTVKENIALALELQHKKADPETIARILDEVDLNGYEKRKPNELSGGQKQRVAIARALVKEPEIIFADEPTGALDSNTGKQVFDTLKKLSKSRLVIVVSHDREFAEFYGDRVIELKDGEVISDITKTENAPKAISTNVKLLKDNLIRIEKGYQLSQADLTYINNLMKNSQSEAYLSIDGKINKSIQTSAMISEAGNVQSFVETDNDKVEQGDEKWQVIKSKFPNKAALRMGAKSLKIKPFRLITTILLSSIAFTEFGFAITTNFTTKEDIVSSAIINNKETSLIVQSVSDYRTNEITDSIINDAKDKMGVDFARLYSLNNSYSLKLTNGPGNSYSSGGQGYYYVTYIRSAFRYDDVKQFGFDIVYGNEPTADNEILITKHTLESYEDFNAEGLSKETIRNNPAAIIGYQIGDYVVKGVLDTKVDLSGFLDFKNNQVKQEDMYGVKASILSQYNSSDFHGAIYTKGVPANSNCFSMVAPTFSDHNRVKRVVYECMKTTQYGANGYGLRNAIGSTFISISSLLDGLKDVFMVLGIITAIFASLLFYNFISISINNRRREIGILRAVGARGFDVFKIFFSESGIISLINFTISSVATLLICIAINNSLAANTALSFSILFPNVLTFISLFAIALASGFISSFLPTMKLAHQKPIDAIREK